MSDSFSRRRAHMIQLKARREGVETDVPRRHAAKAAFSKCPHCGAGVSKRELARTLYVCPQCGYHHPIGAYLRLSMLLDSKSFCELEERLAAPNTLGFPGYEEKLRAARKATGLTEGAVAARGKVDGSSAIFCVLDSRFLMGSMGAAVGEKVTRAVEYADRMGLPLVIFSASGGARMQEGILSLMQMAKTSAALGRFSSHGGFYLSVLTHPTTGGVTASFASLGDRADHRTKTAGRVSVRRISGGTRICGSNRLQGPDAPGDLAASAAPPERGEGKWLTTPRLSG